MTELALDGFRKIFPRLKFKRGLHMQLINLIQAQAHEHRHDTLARSKFLTIHVSNMSVTRV